MIADHDARTTVELDDRYVVLPQSFMDSRSEGYSQYGDRMVAEDFEYSSDKNSEWLDVEGVRALIDRS